MTEPYRKNAAEPKKDKIDPQLCIDCIYYRIHSPGLKVFYKCLSPVKNSNYRYLGVVINEDDAVYCNHVRGDSVLCDGFSPKASKPQPVDDESDSSPQLKHIPTYNAGGSKTGLYVGGFLVFLSLFLGGIILAVMGSSSEKQQTEESR